MIYKEGFDLNFSLLGKTAVITGAANPKVNKTSPFYRIQCYSIWFNP